MAPNRDAGSAALRRFAAWTAARSRFPFTQRVGPRAAAGGWDIVLTENVAILTYLGRRYPDAGLMPCGRNFIVQKKN
jgi:hypothetical protein